MRIIHPATGETAATIPDAIYLLQTAREAYEAAKKQADDSRRAETAALTDLNKAQKVFDAAVNDIRADAPHSSDWSRRTALRGEAVGASA